MLSLFFSTVAALRNYPLQQLLLAALVALIPSAAQGFLRQLLRTANQVPASTAARVIALQLGPATLTVTAAALALQTHPGSLHPASTTRQQWCPGVYGRGCGGRLRWACYGDPSWAHWACSNWQNCDYREYPAPRKGTPELSIQIDTPDTIEVAALPGAEEAVVHCGGVAAVLRAAGVDLSSALTSHPPPGTALLPPQPGQQQQQQQQQHALCEASVGQAGSKTSGDGHVPENAAGVEPGLRCHSLPSSPRAPLPPRFAHSLPASPVQLPAVGGQAQQPGATKSWGVNEQQQQHVTALLSAPMCLAQSAPASPTAAAQSEQTARQLSKGPHHTSSLPVSPPDGRQPGAGGASQHSPASQRSLASALQQLRPLSAERQQQAASRVEDMQPASADSTRVMREGQHSVEPAQQQQQQQAQQAQQQAQQPPGNLASAAAEQDQTSDAQQAAAEQQERQGRPDPGRVRFWLADYERVRDTLLAFRQHTGIPLLMRAGCIPKATLQAFRGQVFPRPAPCEVERRYGRLPPFLEAALMPFQREGVRFGLRCGGKCMLADEMGVGKTVQAIALAACYQEEWPLLVVAPASLRLVWAEELEKWLPQLRPSTIHVIEGREGRVAPPNLPLVTITSFEMMQRLTCEGCKQRGQEKQGLCANAGRRCAGAQLCMAAMGWKVIIVDESHQLRTSNRPPDAQHTEAVVSAVRLARRAVFLTGTPSLSRPFDLFRQVDALKPGLLGRDRVEFAAAYCCRRAVPVPGGNGRLRYDHSGLSRGAELHGLLRREVMLRRLKRDVLSQLPPKRRQVIRLPKPKAEHWPKGSAKRGASSGQADSEDDTGGSGSDEADGEEPLEEDVGKEGPGSKNKEAIRRAGKHMSAAHRTALAKLPFVIDWIMHALGARKRGGAAGRGVQDGDEDEPPAAGSAAESGPKFLLFAHHKDVMDGLAAALDGAAGFAPVPFIRIEGATDGEGRRQAAARFRADPAVRVALLSVTAAGVGLDFSCASAVVFAELPEDPSWMRQAEDRAHRKGQRLPVNVYFLCAKGTTDERRWQYLSRSLVKLTAVMDGALSPKAGPAAGEPVQGKTGGGLHVDDIADAELAGMTQAAPALRLPHPQTKQQQQQQQQEGEGGSLSTSHVMVDGEGQAGAALGPPVAGSAQAGDGAGNGLDEGGSRSAGAALPAGMHRAKQQQGCARKQQQCQQGVAEGTAGGGDEAEPDPAVEVWFEVSTNTGRVHFHAAPDGARPLLLSLPMEALAGPHDSPLIDELLQSVSTLTAGTASPAEGATVAAGARAQAAEELETREALADGEILGATDAAECQARAAGEGASPAAVCDELQPKQPAAPPCGGSSVLAAGVRAADDTRLGVAPCTAATAPCASGAGAPSAPGGGPECPEAEPSQRLLGQGPTRPSIVLSGIGPVALDPSLGLSVLRGMVADARTFAAEWRELRAVQQARLCGRVLQAPLDQAVEAVQKEAAAAGAFGSSTSRFVDTQHRSDLALPPGAGWRPVRVKFRRLANEVTYQQPFLASGERLCANCAAPVPGAAAVLPEAVLQGMRLLFCSGQCEARFDLKCNGSAYRRALFKLERGVCVLCKLDCHDLVRRLQAIEKGSRKWEQRRQVLVAQLAPRFLAHGRKAQLERLLKNAVEGNAWHADHIRAVYEGGGLCDVDNLRTLCVLCHMDVTKRQAKERAQERRAKAGVDAAGADRSSPQRPRRRPRVTRIFSDTDSPAPRPAASAAAGGPAAAAAALDDLSGAETAHTIRSAGKSAAAEGAAAREDPDQQEPQPQGPALKRAKARDSAATTSARAAGAAAVEAQQARPKRRPRLKSMFVNDENPPPAPVSGATGGPSKASVAGAAANVSIGASATAVPAAGAERPPPAKKAAVQRRERQTEVYLDSPL
ncbi:hypothetical protein N2152v2_000619 [Parachlorella kessleri]